MTADTAKALVAKLATDKALAEEFAQAKSEEAFLETTKKHGYDVSIEEFTKALHAAKSDPEGELSEAELDQVAGGISIVGVDYTFTVIQIVSK